MALKRTSSLVTLVIVVALAASAVLIPLLTKHQGLLDTVNRLPLYSVILLLSAIVLLSIVGWYWRRQQASTPERATLQGIPASTTPNPLTVNIHNLVSVPQPASTKPLSESTNAPQLAQRCKDDGPALYSLPPRITFVQFSGRTLTEGEGEYAFRAVLATFRMSKPPTKQPEAYITARLSYRTMPQVLDLHEVSTEIARVDHGIWLYEDFNFIEMTVTDTKEVLLVLNSDKTCVAVQDNRHSVEKCNPPAFRQLTFPEGAFFVDVILVDSERGPLIAYSYKITVAPFGVHELIRVPQLHR
jgi:hypothetical protein